MGNKNCCGGDQDQSYDPRQSKKHSGTPSSKKDKKRRNKGKAMDQSNSTDLAPIRPSDHSFQTLDDRNISMNSEQNISMNSDKKDHDDIDKYLREDADDNNSAHEIVLSTE
jgi:hypothetical protein